jgi:TonB-dependent Receptor Plug Domain.
MPRSGVPLGAVIGETTVIRYLPAPHPLTLALIGALLAPLGAAAQSPTSDLVLPTLQVEDDTTSSPYAGKQTLDASYIANQPAGNGDIGSLLKINPAVQYDNGQLSSFTPGEISPAEVSINGAAFYQNNFSIDGIGMNNGIDPAADPSPYRLYSGPGSSQAFALDTRLLGELTVLDSNISAAWGGFTGGVIDAKTRKPSRQARSEISTQMSRSSWTRYHVNEAQRESHANASSWGDGQPEFEKTTWRATTEGWLSDDLGVLASYSRKRSTIPTMFYSSHLVEQFGTEKREQTRAIDNLFVKAVWEANERIELQASLMYAPQEDSYYRSNIVDSQIDISNGGLQANLQLDWRTDWGQIDQQLGLTGNEQSRHGHSDDYYAWIRSDSKDWGTGNSSLQGEYGQVEQEQRSPVQAGCALGSDRHRKRAAPPQCRRPAGPRSF